jgi:dihydroorotase
MIEFIKPDDFHVHLRQGDLLPFTLLCAQNNFGKILAMPNLNPPLLKVENVIQYHKNIYQILEPQNENLQVLMTLYLTNSTTKEDIIRAKQSNIIYACKLYPKNATTNSSFGVDLNNIDDLDEVFTYMSMYGIILCIHGEISDPETDIFHRENIFIRKILPNIIQKFPQLKVVLEHITTKESVEFVKNCPSMNLAATITPQHLWYNRNNLLSGGLKPHNYCLPILKKKDDQLILREAATSGCIKFFAGTDSAPHDRKLKESACGCAGCFTGYNPIELYLEIFDKENKLENIENFLSVNGSNFYNLNTNKDTVKYDRIENMTDKNNHSFYTIPQFFEVNEDITIVPFLAGETLSYTRI